MDNALVIEANSKLQREMGGGWEHFSPAIRRALIFERVMSWLAAQEAPCGGLIAADEIVKIRDALGRLIHDCGEFCPERGAAR